MTIRYVVLLSTLITSSCVSGPPAPNAPDSAGVAIHVGLRALVRVFSQEPQQVLFVRLPGPSCSPTSGELVPGNDEKESFLGNALGGDYHYRGTLHSSDHGTTAQAGFVRSVNKNLVEAGWRPQPDR